MIKLELLLSVAAFAVWIYCLIDVAQTRDDEIRNLNKGAWILIVLFFSVVGSIGWFIFGRPEGPARLAPGERAVPEFPEYDRRGRNAAADPEKDADFLRQVRARAEEQRKRYEQEKKRQEQDGQAE